MDIISRSRPHVAPAQSRWPSAANRAVALAKKYRLTWMFAIIAALVISITTVTLNWSIGNLAEDNLVRAAEENTARDAEHMQAMMRRNHMGHTTSADRSGADGKTRYSLFTPFKNRSPTKIVAPCWKHWPWILSVSPRSTNSS